MNERVLSPIRYLVKASHNIVTLGCTIGGNGGKNFEA